jgi:ankyrin repeat protein
MASSHFVNSQPGSKIISFAKDFPLHYCARIGDHTGLLNHLKSKKDDLFKKDFYGRSPLHYAVTTGT